jgi:hypothetical protein
MANGQGRDNMLYVIATLLGLLVAAITIYQFFKKDNGTGDYIVIPPGDGTDPIGSPALFPTNINYPDGLKGAIWGLPSWSILDGSGTITLAVPGDGVPGAKVGLRIFGIDAAGNKITLKELYPLFGYGPGPINYSFANSSATKFKSYHICIDRYYSMWSPKNIKIVRIDGGILVLK